MRHALYLLLIQLLMCSCSQDTPGLLGEGSARLDASEMKLLLSQPEGVGRISFLVGGTTNEVTKKFASDRAYRSFWVVLVPGRTAFQKGDLVYVVGTESEPGTAILQLLNAEKPWKDPRPYIEALANHLQFSGDLDGHEWRISSFYPDQTIHRILHLLRPVLDSIPEQK
jgi:hypothetical protein